MFNYLNRVVRCFFGLPTILRFAWLESAFLFSKAFVCELLLIWTETFMIFAWFARVFVDVYCHHRPTRVDRDVPGKVIWFSSAAILLIIILIVLGIFCFTAFTLLKCIKDITLWINLLRAITILAFKYCWALISFVTTTMVVAHSMYAYQIVTRSIRRILRATTPWFEYSDQSDQHFTTNSLIRRSIFVHVIVWTTDMFSLTYILGLVILVTNIIIYKHQSPTQST
ncbi:hypothetical protein ACI65C_012839 [Semiaphis heraclei]